MTDEELGRQPGLSLASGLRAGVGRRARRDRPWFRVDPGDRHSSLVQSAGRHDGRPCLARSPGCSDRDWIRRPGPSPSVAGNAMASCASSSNRRGSRWPTSPRCRTSRSRARARPPATGRVSATPTSRPPRRRVEIVRADGEIERIDRTTPGDVLHGAVVSLGALGVVSSVTLDIEPTFRMRQVVYEDLALSELVDHFDEIVSAAYSVSLFTDWSGPSFHQVWLKARLDATDGSEAPARGAVRGAARRSGPAPDPGLPGRGVYAPAGSPGSVARAAPALPAGSHAQRRRRAAERVPRRPGRCRGGAPGRRSVARSPVATGAGERDPNRGGRRALAQPRLSTGFRRDPFHLEARVRRVLDLLPDVEAVLEPFEPRPHWGKLFATDARVLRSRYERRRDFVALAQSSRSRREVPQRVRRRVRLRRAGRRDVIRRRRS